MSTQPTRTLKPMVGVVVVSHEQVAFSMMEAARRVVGTLPGVTVSGTTLSHTTTKSPSASIAIDGFTCGPTSSIATARWSC